MKVCIAPSKGHQHIVFSIEVTLKPLAIGHCYCHDSFLNQAVACSREILTEVTQSWSGYGAKIVWNLCWLALIVPFQLFTPRSSFFRYVGQWCGPRPSSTAWCKLVGSFNLPGGWHPLCVSFLPSLGKIFACEALGINRLDLVYCNRHWACQPSTHAKIECFALSGLDICQFYLRSDCIPFPVCCWVEESVSPHVAHLSLQSLSMELWNTSPSHGHRGQLHVQ